MRYRFARQLLMYNGHYYEWYPSDWAEDELTEMTGESFGEENSIKDSEENTDE